MINIRNLLSLNGPRGFRANANYSLVVSKEGGLKVKYYACLSYFMKLSHVCDVIISKLDIRFSSVIYTFTADVHLKINEEIFGVSYYCSYTPWLADHYRMDILDRSPEATHVVRCIYESDDSHLFYSLRYSFHTRFQISSYKVAYYTVGISLYDSGINRCFEAA